MLMPHDKPAPPPAPPRRAGRLWFPEAARRDLAGRRVVVVGGGVGGLAAAIRLAARGAGVTLLEQGPRVGGKLNRRVMPHPGRPHEHFTFDTGPSLLTLPLVFAELFEAAGEDVRDWLTIERLDPVARYVWPDGQAFELRRDPEAMAEQVRQIAPGDVDGWRGLMARGRKIWELAGEDFLGHAPEQLLRRRGSPMDGLRMASVPFRIGMFRRYSKVIDAHVRHRRLREVLYQYATYSGASPFTAPGTLAVIPYVEVGLGGFYVRGGMYALAEALAGLAARLGVEVRTGARVHQIDVRGGRVHGVVTDAGVEAADAVVVNADTVTAYRKLIAPADRPHMTDAKLAKLDPGGSGMVLLLGVEGRYPQLAHHTKFMPDDYAADLRAMFETRSVPTDPCIYVCASSRSDPSQAPDGCENLFVLASAPALWGGGERVDWDAEAGPYRDRLVARLERFGLSDLNERVVAEDHFHPRLLESTYDAHAGSIYGVGGTSRRQAFLRPPNRDPKIAGLFFAGGATHPGGGLPLVALSGKIACELCADSLAGR